MQQVASPLQRRFGHRRRAIRPRSSVNFLKKEKAQSTLTQLDFVSTPSVSRDAESDEDEDFVEPRPRKKQRKARSGWDDTSKTLTQIGFVSSSRTEDERASTESEDTEPDLNDHDAALQSQYDTSTPKPLRQPTAVTRTVCDNVDDTWSIGVSNTGTRSRVSTPQSRRLRIEASSSQSPPSIKPLKHLSPERVTASAHDRSPLSERSVNISTSPCRQSKLVFSAGSSKFPWYGETGYSAIAQSQASHSPSRTRPPRKFVRTTTVQDSEIEDGDLGPERTVKEEDPETLQSNNDEQFTCDPANAALERDAARFGWTQSIPTDDPLEIRRCVDEEETWTFQKPDEKLQRDIHGREQDQLFDTLPTSAGNMQRSKYLGPSSIETASRLQSRIIPNSQPTPSIFSSPTMLRPSQISTVGSSEGSLEKLMSSSYTEDVEDYLTVHSPAELSMNRVPDITEMDGPDSSSPLPLPPWSPRAQCSWLHGTTKVSESCDQSLDSDFSLPPPPPMSWRSCHLSDVSSQIEHQN